ncbi:MAG: hypothetical protein J2P38_09750 [Candidatus Dormibacteraeota bacterium]|nr:hypothetical protein [Candidatus Dormibacteraeota bacterium]
MYQLAVQMADQVSERRAAANTFFLTVNSALLAVVGIVPQVELVHQSTPGSAAGFGMIVLALAGLLLSGTWWTLLRSYRQLNEAKFQVINEIEVGLPVRPFTSEWQYLAGKRRPWQRYFELGRIERVVPLVYAAIYVAALIRALIA